MHIIAFLFFVGMLTLACALIHQMLIDHADQIIAALRGEPFLARRSVTLVNFGEIKASHLSPINDNVILPLAA
jgi:hypothetical protein